MRREQLIAAIGVQTQGDYSFVVCESQEETLIVGPLMEAIYRVQLTSWERSKDGNSYWKYLYLVPHGVSAYGNGYQIGSHMCIAAADLFPEAVYATWVDISDLI